MKYPRVLNEWDTLTQLLKGVSIARYGDGELKICRGHEAIAQKADAHLAERLKEILLSNDERCLVGIPRIESKQQLNPEKHRFWAKYLDQSYIKMYNPQKVYASAFVTRPDSIPYINTPKYFETFQTLWEGKHVILLNGDNRKFDKNERTLANAGFLERWDCPSKNAWDMYDKLLYECYQQPKDVLFVVSLGPTATVLAYDLARMGYHACDLGHLGMFFNRFYEGVGVDVTTKHE